MTGRMPRKLYIHFAVAFVALAGLIAAPNVAHADPHALFYTAIGQRQLFFNVLAALDQADYVEPATGPLSRQELQNKRDERLRTEAAAIQKGFNLVEDPLAKETKTTLSALLSRNVTLEGNDLWTTYLAHQYALDVARVAGAEDYVDNVLCKLVLGRKDCSEKSADVAKRGFNIIKNPVEWASLPATHGWLAALITGTPLHGEKAKEVRDNSRNGESFELGYAANPGIGKLQEAKQAASTGIKKAIEETITSTAYSILPLGVSSKLYDGINIAENGAITLAMKPSDPGFYEWYNEQTSLQRFRDQAFAEAAASGQAMIGNIQNVVADDGGNIAPELKLFNKGDAEASSDYCTSSPPGCSTKPEGEIQGLTDLNSAVLPIVEVPVSIAAGAAQAAAQTVGDLNTNQADAVVDLTQPQSPFGDDKLLQENPKHGGVVAGIQSDSTAPVNTTPGRVLHETISTLDGSKQDDDLISSRLRGLGKGEFRSYETRFTAAINPKNVGQTSCGCNVDEAANAFGTQIAAKLKQLSHL